MNEIRCRRKVSASAASAGTGGKAVPLVLHKDVVLEVISVRVMVSEGEVASTVMAVIMAMAMVAVVAVTMAAAAMTAMAMAKTVATVMAVVMAMVMMAVMAMMAMAKMAMSMAKMGVAAVIVKMEMAFWQVGAGCQPQAESVHTERKRSARRDGGGEELPRGSAGVMHGEVREDVEVRGVGDSRPWP